ncbi:MAG: hypothetical protein AAGK04_12155 [Planctomycetota bacterium]
MTTKTKRVTLGVIMSAAIGAITIASGVREEDAKPKLADRFEALAPLVGYEWHVNEKWADGTTLEAKTEYRVGMAGQFIVSDTWARDNGGEWYHRYHNIYVIDPNTGEHSSVGVTFDGTSSSVTFDVKKSDDGDTLIEYNSEMQGGVLRQTLEIEQDQLLWNVWMKPGGAPDFMPLMTDGVWRRGKKLDA